MGTSNKYWYDGQLSPDGQFDNLGTGYWYEGSMSSDSTATSQTITGSAGITSGEAFGSGGTATNDFELTGSGIASEEAFGTPGYIQPGIWSNAGIVSEEAFGAASYDSGIVTADIYRFTGIPSAEAFGSGGAVIRDQSLVGGAGITSGEAFGSTGGRVDLGDIIGTAGIASAEAFGSGGVVAGPIVGTAGIASAEAFGSTGAIITNEIFGTAGIASAEAFGANGSVGMIVGSAGIASEEAFGSGGVLVYDQTLTGSAGIASAEAFGSGGFVSGPQDITGSAGIASEEAFGTPGTVAHIAGSAGIASEEAFGSGGTVAIVTLAITGGAGIASEEAFGSGGSVGHGLTGYFGIESAEAFGTGGAVIPVSTGDPSILLYWNGVRSNDHLKINTLSIRTPVRGRGEASFVWYSESGTVRPDLSDRIDIYYRVEPTNLASEVELIFSGTVESVSERKLVKYQNATEIELNITCNDWNQILDRRLFTYVVPAGATCLTILQAMQDQVLTEEGIGLSAGDPGIVVPEKTYDNATCSEVIAEMCEASGWDARVGYDRILYFGPNPLPAADAAAPYVISDTSQEFTEITVSKARNASKYRNVMAMVLSGSDRANKALDTFTATGGTEYRLTTALTQAPVVYVNSVEQTVTVWGSFVPGWSVAWESGTNLLRFNPASPPTAGATIEAEYPSDVANILRVSNAVEIAARATQEGGTGKYEAKASFGGEGGDVSTMAGEVLGRYGEFGVYSASVESNHWGWKPGQDVVVSITKPYMTPGTYYIEEVSHTFEYRVNTDPNWTSDFRTTLRVVKNGKKGQGYRDVLKPGGGGIGGGGGWGGGGGFTPGGGGWNVGGGNWSFNETNNTNTSNGGAPQRYVFSVAASQPGCTNGGIVEGHELPPQIVCFPGVIREIQAYLAVHDGDQPVIFDVRLNGVSLFTTTSTRPQFEPHGTTPDYTPVIFNRFSSRYVPVRRGDLLQVVVLQSGSTDPDASGEEQGTDGQVVVVVV